MMQPLRTFPLCTGARLPTYYSAHYICDAHWNIEVTFTVCKKLYEALGNSRLDFGHYALVNDQWVCGDVARSALCPPVEQVFDAAYYFSGFEGRGADGTLIIPIGLFELTGGGPDVTRSAARRCKSAGSSWGTCDEGHPLRRCALARRTARERAPCRIAPAHVSDSAWMRAWKNNTHGDGGT